MHLPRRLLATASAFPWESLPDAKRKLDEQNNALMREAAGPMAGMNIPGMPKLF